MIYASLGLIFLTASVHNKRLRNLPKLAKIPQIKTKTAILCGITGSPGEYGYFTRNHGPSDCAAAPSDTLKTFIFIIGVVRALRG
jgi:hypothetical protein